MSYFMIDTETDGPFPDRETGYSMIQIGAVVVRDGLKDTFLGKLRPISIRYQSEALKVVGVTREETLEYPDPREVMMQFNAWVKEKNVGKRPMFISDNNSFDYLFYTWYSYYFTGESPFGHSGTNLGSLYKGIIKDTFKNFKHLRVTKHTHNPVDDAMGNAEALIHMRDVMGLKILLE